MTESELTDWLRAGNRKLWTFRVSDKFGDSGLTGLISIDVEGEIGTVADFVLSCRVMGRKVEETMLHMLIEYARSAGVKSVRAKYLPTRRNKPCLDFWRKSGFAYDEAEDLFSWDASKEYPVPGAISLS